MAEERILIVEPDTTLSHLIAEQVSSTCQIEPLVASGPDDGLQLARSQNPQLMLLHLPTDLSAGLLRGLHDEARTIPSVLVVDRKSARVPVEFFRLGVRDYLVYSSMEEDFAQSLGEVLQRELNSQDNQTRIEDLSQSNRDLERKLKDFNILLKISRSITSVLELDVLLSRITEAAVFITGAEEGYLLLLNENGAGSLCLRAAQNLGEKKAREFSLPVSDSIAGQVVRSGKPVLLNGNDKQSFKVKTGHLVKGLLNVPLTINGEVLGVLGVDNQLSQEPFTATHLQQLTALADIAATALQNALESTVLQQRARIDRDRLLLLMEAVDNAVWLVDGNLTLIAQNNVASDLLNLPAVDTIGRPVSDVIPLESENAGAFCQIIRQAMEDGQPESFTEVTLPSSWVAQLGVSGGQALPIMQGDSAIGAVCVFWRSSPKRGEKYLEFEFANMASHLFRTPLSFIQTAIDLLMNSELDPEQRKSMLDKMRKQGQQLTESTNELLKMLRLETEGMHAQIYPNELPPLIERVLNLVRYEDPRYQFEVSLPESLPLALVDSTKTELVLLNLLLNAVRRCPEGCIIRIEATVQDAEIVIAVMDNGQPVPEKLLDRQFEQFYPVDDENGKMPSTYHLGLYTTKKLIELQNGRIWAKNQSGGGVRFNFTVPIWEGFDDQNRNH